MNAEPAPFARALREAVDRSGFSLSELRDLLSVSGAPPSPATLSYWQSGRSLPSKPGSLATVAVLEKILRLQRGALTSLLPIAGTLGVRRPPEHRPEEAPHLDGIARRPVQAAEAICADLVDEPFRRLSMHSEIELDALGAVRAYTRRLTLAALRDGVDRVVVWVGVSTDEAYLVLRPSLNCRVGDSLKRDGGEVTELLLDRPLRAGEVSVVEMRGEVVGASTRETEVVHCLLNPVGELVLDVRFDPGCTPENLERFSAEQDGETSCDLRVVAGRATSVFLNPPLGRHGLRWHW